MGLGYQTFPRRPGSSRSFEKLLSLSLPELAGRKVLDVGCNTGYFCGWAAFRQTARVVGIDRDPGSIAEARERFPECSFVCADWSAIGRGSYDCILCLSSVHYADDQETFIAMLMRRLTPEGLLVLEMGVAPGEDDAFVAVERRLGEHATDARLFPTWKKAHSLLADYAFKYMGESVRQAGDPLPRHVFHVQRRKPLAVLLMDGHYSGKTYAAGKMMHPSVKTVAGEQVYHDIMDGRIAATDALKKRIRYVDGTRHMMPPAITSDICAAGLLPDLADVFIAMADNGDFVCEHYIPGPYRERLCELMDDAGFFVVICTMFNSVKASPPWVKIRPPYSEYEAYAAYLEDKFAGAGAR